MYRLNKIGTLKPQAPSAHENSRLGIGFEKLDRAVFDPERAYDKLAAIGVNHTAISVGDFELNTFQRCLCHGVQLMNDEATQRLVEELQHIGLVALDLNSLGCIVQEITVR